MGVLYLKGEKAAIAVGSMTTALVILKNAVITDEELLRECIAACKFVQVGARLVEDKWGNLVSQVHATLSVLERKIEERRQE
jgi:hypothetical protein